IATMLAADLFPRHERDRATPPDDRRRSVSEGSTGVRPVRRRSGCGGQQLRVPVNPAWYLNLLAHPIVTVEVSGERAKCRGRSAEGRERELPYGRLGEQMPGFFVASGGRNARFPIVVLMESGIPEGDRKRAQLAKPGRRTRQRGPFALTNRLSAVTRSVPSLSASATYHAS